MSQTKTCIAFIVSTLSIASAACDVEELAFRPPAMRAVSIGEAHSCALSESGRVYCWGDGSFGQLGIGRIESTQYAVAVSTSDQFQALDAGGHHTCALDTEGRAFCWGANDFGQLGTGDRERGLSPRAVNTSERFASITAGWTHTCALTTTGRAFCWGSGTYGEVGTNEFAEFTTTPAAVSTDVMFAQISAGGRHTCARALDGLAYCWGANEVAQLGNGAESAPRSAPVRVQADFAFSDISAGWNHSCGVTPQRLGFCWGENAFGETGTGWQYLSGVPAHPFPGQVVNYGEIMFRQISAGKNFSCGVRDQGSAYCWGKGDHGQLGSASLNNGIQPQWVKPGPGRPFVPTSDVFARIDAGGNNHVCAHANNGTVFCWGDGSSGQLGSGERLSMVAMPVLEVR